MRGISTTALTLAALGLWAVGPAAAQESTTRGFNIGLHLSAASVTFEDQDRNDAGGAGLSLGYGFNRRFTLFAQLDAAEFDEQATGNVEGDLVMGHAELGVRFYFANSLSKWVPYLQGALGGRVVSVQNPVVGGTGRNEVSYSGSALTLGGGLGYYLSRSWALDVQLLWTGGEFTTLTVDNASVSGFEVDANSTRFNVGVNWWP